MVPESKAIYNLGKLGVYSKFKGKDVGNQACQQRHIFLNNALFRI